MLITLEPLVLQRSHAPQNDHKSKTYLLPKEQGLFTSEKSDAAACPISDFGVRLHIRLFKLQLNTPSIYVSVCDY